MAKSSIVSFFALKYSLMHVFYTLLYIITYIYTHTWSSTLWCLFFLLMSFLSRMSVDFNIYTGEHNVQILNFVCHICQWTEVTRHMILLIRRIEYFGLRWTSDPFSQLFWAIRMRKWEIKNGQNSRMKSNDASVSSLNVNVEVPQNFFFQRHWLVCYLESITFVQHLQTH